jgi:hypothetical protein
MRGGLRKYANVKVALRFTTFVGIASFVLCACGHLSAESDSTSVIAVIDVASKLGGGATLSPNGRSLVYVGTDGLHLRDLTTSRDRLLQQEVGPANDVFQSPVFTPDGTRVLVSASGGTWYYPSDIYSIAVDGSGANKLTISVPASPETTGNAAYQQYFYSAVMSPTSSTILIWVYDTVKATNNVGILDSTFVEHQRLLPGEVRILTEGKPVAWSNDGRSFYLSREDKLMKFDLDTNKMHEVSIRGTVVGITLGSETLAVDDGAGIYFAKLGPGHNSERRSTFRRSQFVMSKVGKLEELPLESMQWTATGLTLLVYQGIGRQRLELVNTGFNP